MDITMIVVITILVLMVGSTLKRILNKSLKLLERELDHLEVEQQQRLEALKNKLVPLDE
jgi:hypothetical protein